MNFLAHALLSGDDESIILGNFLGDFVKGNALFDYEERVQQGIRLHRQIDTFTDQHPLVKEAVVLTRPYMSKYSGVAVDIFFDYFLAKNWRNFSSVELRVFTQRLYEVIQANEVLLPSRAKMFKNFMLQYDILYQYQFLEKIDFVFQGMYNRSGRKSNLNKAVEVIEKEGIAIEELFMAYFPKLQEQVENILKE